MANIMHVIQRFFTTEMFKETVLAEYLLIEDLGRLEVAILVNRVLKEANVKFSLYFYP